MSEKRTVWMHVSCSLPEDGDPIQPPERRQDSLTYCYRCGVGSTNVKPLLYKYEVDYVEPKPEVVEEAKAEVATEELTEREQEIAALRAQIAALEK